MKGKPKKAPREKDLTSRYKAGGMDEDRIEASEQFKARNKTLTADKIARTAILQAEKAAADDTAPLPVGEVMQVYSLFAEVRFEGVTYLCVVRKTLNKRRDTHVVVGDKVRFRDRTRRDDSGIAISSGGDPAAFADGVIEEILPRATVLTRADSFKAIVQHPIVANAEQMLIVASIRQPNVKWGLVDRMIVAALAGGLKPIVCLNKMDLAVPEAAAANAPAPEQAAAEEDLDDLDDLDDEDDAPRRPRVRSARQIARDDLDILHSRDVMAHYESMGIQTLRTSVQLGLDLGRLKETLADRVTVLAGHSGVGKSSLIRAIQPQLDLKIGEVSHYTDKGRHTTTSARRYELNGGGAVVDTPGVKLFGLWGVTRANINDFFPDIAADSAPSWRKESYERILGSLPQGW